MAHRNIRFIDVLALTFVSVMLFSLFLPALQTARSRGMPPTRKRLKALGLALQNYHDHHKVFPPGIVAQGPNAEYVGLSDPTMASASGLTLILPFLEEEETYKLYNMSLASFSMQNATAICRPVSAFVAPNNPRKSDPLPWGIYRQPPGSQLNGPAPTDYAFCLGGTAIQHQANPFSLGCAGSRYPNIHRPAAGPFNVNSSVRIDIIKDGTSNTMLMGESVGGSQLRLGLNSARESAAGDEHLATADPERFCDQAWSQSFVGTRDGRGGFGSVFAATAFNAHFDMNRILVEPSQWMPLPPNEGNGGIARPTWYARSNPYFDIASRKPITGVIGGVQGFRGFIPGCVLVVFADGSVRAIPNSIDPKVWVAYSTIVGREHIPEDQ